VGEITDEYDRDELHVQQVGDNQFRVNGSVPISEINELLDVELPDEEWDTVAGLMLGLLGKIPAQGEEVRYQNLTFVAERVVRRRIAQVLIRREPVTEEQPAEARAE
jgi:CBS domain containing-hemolysin-like protein